MHYTQHTLSCTPMQGTRNSGQVQHHRRVYWRGQTAFLGSDASKRTDANCLSQQQKPVAPSRPTEKDIKRANSSATPPPTQDAACASDIECVFVFHNVLYRSIGRFGIDLRMGLHSHSVRVCSSVRFIWCHPLTLEICPMHIYRNCLGSDTTYLKLFAIDRSRYNKSSEWETLLHTQAHIATAMTRERERERNEMENITYA